jgi:hypothetical protein
MDEDHEHSGHNSTDCSDKKVGTRGKIVNKAPLFHFGVQWKVLLPIWNMVHSKGGLKTMKRMSESLCLDCTLSNKSAAYLGRALGNAGARSVPSQWPPPQTTFQKIVIIY